MLMLQQNSIIMVRLLLYYNYMAGLRMNDRGSVAALAPWGLL
jgi:hypothetical protein